MKNKISRRNFLPTTAKTGIALGLPSIVPASVFGANAPSNRINIGCIGAGRIARTHDMPGVWQYKSAQIIAVCDLDSNRAEDGKKLVNDYYTKRDGKPFDGVKSHTDYREMLLNKDIDAVTISTPDHWHALCAIDAARAGKHVYLQKPTSLTISEGRIMADIVNVQSGSQLAS